MENGKLKGLMPISGHYMPTEDDFARCEAELRRQGVDFSGDLHMPANQEGDMKLIKKCIKMVRQKYKSLDEV
eukprot:SAG31_NODE_1174_length_9538_cov_3.152453_4_plen_72_part_00